MKTSTSLLLASFITFQLNAQDCKQVNMGQAINSEYSENGPKISPDGKTLYFWRWRSEDAESKNYGTDIYRSEMGEDGHWKKAEKMGKPFNTGKYDAVEAVGRNGNSLLLHGAYEKGKYIGNGFSISSLTEKGWSKPQKLEVTDFTNMHKGKYYGGTLSNDGTVLILTFSEKSGAEENDMYVSRKQPNGTWSRPVIMSAINSEHGEAGAFISNDGATLYFSSNRDGGVGCYDIYMCTRKDNTWLNWTEPKNLGPTVNSNVCDIHFSLDAKEENAYLGTVHDSKFGGEDIVTVKLEEDLKPKKDMIILTSDSLLASTIQKGCQLVQPVNTSTDSIAKPAQATLLQKTFTANNFVIYPNPTDANFFLEINGTYSRTLIITIMDISGSILEKTQLEHLEGIFTQRFDVSTYAKGIYFVNITDGTSMISKRLIIQ